MRRTGLWWAAAIVIVANTAAWGVAAWNMGGDPEAILVLTERELRLPARQAENTALTLSLMFEPPRSRAREELTAAGWFDRAKLMSIGFDCSRPVTAEHADYYRTRPPRATFAALEYAATPSPDTHLVPIDVGNDAAALRLRHPDRRLVAIVEATAVLIYVANPGQAPFLAGRVTAVLPGEIHVPREWRGLLTPLQPSQRVTASPPPPREPRFRATIAWGRRFEPWIANVELLTPEPAR